MARRKPWLALPFLGSSEAPERRRSSTAQAKQHRMNEKRNRHGNVSGAGLEYELTREATAKEVAAMTEEDVVQDYNSPIHMWVVTTLFPLIAGTFGPMASMFNICAIAISWRVVVSPGKNDEATGHHIPDPHWLVAVNIVSLAIAVLANLSLLGQMTNRLRYNISGPITIVGFYISGFVDIGLVAAASTHLPLPDNPQATYSQAFYYAAFSGAIYVILSFLLSWTAYGIWVGHYSDQFKLSMSQRSLMLQTILFLSYVLCAGAIYSSIEGWQYLDAIYFTVVTLFTIGFGDLVPTTHLGRSLFFPFAVGGILFVGVIIANIRTLVLESGSVKVSTRLVEKARYKAIKSGKPEEGILKIRGMYKRDTNADTELERREKEFSIMREIQAAAARNNRLFALAFAAIAFVILWFIGAIVFWKAEGLSVDGQDWSYFESLYFTFVAQLTIGYGDFEPQTNSAKPAFVFWSLIALPTLTVLIGAIGDSVSSFVNWYTEWIGNNTQNFYNMVKAVVRRNKPSEIKNAATSANKEKRLKIENENDDGFEKIAQLEQRHTHLPLDFNIDDLTQLQASVAEEKYRPFMLLKAADHILTKHLDADPPRKYSFKEWSWLLKLLGEDENDETRHRRVGQHLPDDVKVVSPVNTGERLEGEVWSWLGQESPLMSLEEDSEPKWVLKRLMATLEKELKARAERHIERDLPKVSREREDFAEKEEDKIEPSSSSAS